jgi:hypothetical protein
MNELIWFSIPGAIFLILLSVLGCLSCVPDSLIIGLAPVIGFFIHQIYRCFFELCGGWSRPSRSIIKRLKTDYSVDNPKKAFLIWEMTFYSNDIPEPFRSHDRGAWHYVMSFRSCSLVSSVSAAITFFLIISCCKTEFCLPFLGFLFAAIVFWMKAHLTFLSIEKQEIAIIELYKCKFDKTASKIQSN